MCVFLGCVYFWATTPILMSVFTFITYVLLGNKLTPAKVCLNNKFSFPKVKNLVWLFISKFKVFTSLALFNMLISPLNSFPWVINGMVQAWVKYCILNEYSTSLQCKLCHACQFFTASKSKLSVIKSLQIIDSPLRYYPAIHVTSRWIKELNLNFNYFRYH